MLNNITLGQYFPGDSPLHRMDPRMKLIVSIIFTAALYMAGGLRAYALIAAADVALILMSGIPFRIIMRAIRPIMYLIIFTTTINVFWITGETPLFSWWVVNIYPEGLTFALMMVLRIASLIIAASLFISYTTSPTALTDAMERLLKPLAVIKLPVHEFSLIMTITLRFIPALIEETEKIMNAQTARGANFYTGSIVKRAKALVPVLIPLIISAFRRAFELATAMECRCYSGGKGRTKMKVLHLGWIDLAALILAGAFMAGVALL